ncbi:hypothetical protein HU200_066657 [Digitaria exilis]|uniref:Uncharacterized protein n=1 Tax=Digitaria exilis TaxID=1010633 RepID=A0A835A1L8_9POAL|nr:hypothetical protein HU200_066657 [Digitaria exilis]
MVEKKITNLPAGSMYPRRLLPDGGKIKGALRVAATQARHPSPDVLARLMTAEYPPSLLSPVLAKLKGTEVLNTDDICQIMNLLDSQWPPIVPQAKIEFWCRPDDGKGNTCSRDNNGALLISTRIGEGYVANVSVVKIKAHEQVRGDYISGQTFPDLEPKFSMLMQELMEAKPRIIMNLNPRKELEYDASPCEHMLSLKLHLLDRIHDFYITALAIMPKSPSLLRALLVAGHCYGPLDPLSNIIINSIWYHAAFPLAQDAADQLPEGILDTRLLARVESRSLDGLVSLIGPCRHNALVFLHHRACEIPSDFFDCSSCLRAAQCAKHPQHDEFASLMTSLLLFREAHSDFHTVLKDPLILSSQFDRDQNALLFGVKLPSASAQMEPPCSLLPQASKEMSRKKSAFMRHLKFLHGKLDKLLHKYNYQHPWEPNFRVVLICGARESKSPRGPKFYYVNFLAKEHFDENRRCTLFFAEFWDTEAAKPSICCPVDDCCDDIGELSVPCRMPHCSDEREVRRSDTASHAAAGVGLLPDPDGRVDDEEDDERLEEGEEHDLASGGEREEEGDCGEGQDDAHERVLELLRKEQQ